MDGNCDAINRQKKVGQRKRLLVSPKLTSEKGENYHPGGAHVVMGDVATKFITDTIDTGNLLARPPNFESQNGVFGKSPFGAWGAMGTRNGGEPDPNTTRD